MKSTFFTFLSLFLLFACKKEIKTTSEDWQIVSENVQFKEDGNTIVFPEIANVPNAFLVEEGKIIQLDKNQKKIESADSAKFVLTKEK